MDDNAADADGSKKHAAIWSPIEVLPGSTRSRQLAIARMVQVISIAGEAAIADGDLHLGLATLRSERFDLLDDIHAGNDGAENDVFLVEPARDDRGDEELRAVGVGARVGHGQKTRAIMLQGEVLVGEFVAVDGLSTRTIVVREVATLEHEVRDDAMERRALVAEPFLASAKRTEVLGRLGNDVLEEFESDATSSLAIDVDVEENFRVSHDGCP